MKPSRLVTSGGGDVTPSRSAGLEDAMDAYTSITRRRQ